jgi:hypothetical protein
MHVLKIIAPKQSVNDQEVYIGLREWIDLQDILKRHHISMTLQQNEKDSP